MELRSGGGRYVLYILVLLVAKGILDFGLAAVCGRSEIVVAHGDGNVAVQLNLMVVEDNI